MWENRAKEKIYQYSILWLDEAKTRFLKIPHHRYEKLESELNGTLTAAKLLGYKYKVDSSIYQCSIYVESPNVNKEDLIIHFIKQPNSSELFKISVETKTSYIYNSMDWLMALRKARQYL